MNVIIKLTGFWKTPDGSGSGLMLQAPDVQLLEPKQIGGWGVVPTGKSTSVSVAVAVALRACVRSCVRACEAGCFLWGLGEK